MSSRPHGPFSAARLLLALTALVAALPGLPVATAVADVTDADAVRVAVASLEAALGPADLLIACAGIGRKTSTADFDAEEHDRA